MVISRAHLLHSGRPAMRLVRRPRELLAGGHRESARQAYLWAQSFYDSATYFVDESADPSCFPLTWQALYDCWLKSLPLFDPSIEPVGIPYAGTTARLPPPGQKQGTAPSAADLHQRKRRIFVGHVVDLLLLMASLAGLGHRSTFSHLAQGTAAHYPEPTTWTPSQSDCTEFTATPFLIVLFFSFYRLYTT
jgi:hypothetical protein